MVDKTPTCRVCDSKIPYNRNPKVYCSKKCQADLEGYSEKHEKRLKDSIAGTTAWRPQPLEPVFKIVSAKPVAVFSDIHLPIHDEKWTHHAMVCAKKFGAEWLVLNGDVMDLNQISRHMGTYYRRKSELDDDFAACEAFLKIVTKEFKNVVWLSGNHCLQRLIQLFRGEVSAQRLLKLVGDYQNLKITSRSFIDVNDDVRLCHPRQYSRIRGALPQRLAQRWQKSVACGHQHHSAMASSPDGKWQAVDIPSLVDVNAQDYVRNELNDFPEPQQGFAMVFGNKIQNFDKYTPWKLWGLPELDRG